MNQTFDLGKLDWHVAGSIPDQWRLAAPEQWSIHANRDLDIRPVPARVPGSVQAALRAAGELPDWNVGLNARQCDWVENRDWIFEAKIPDTWLAAGHAFRLQALGLDYRGLVRVNGREVGTFANAFVPHTFDLAPALRERDNILQLIFTTPPRWLGQFGRTCEITDWKPRFNYFWDWTARLVQVGVWDALLLEVSDGPRLEREAFKITANLDAPACSGQLRVEPADVAKGLAPNEGADLIFMLERGGEAVRTERLAARDFAARGLDWRGLEVEPWWPNGLGAQPRYTLRCLLAGGSSATGAERELDALTWGVGFKHIEWRPCVGAPAEATPWLCVINGRMVFLEGVNWTPLRPNFADVTRKDYRRMLTLYRDLGFNLLRVWGGACLEKEWFYDLCDELGLMVWQEFPLSSSGVDNWPPDTEPAMTELCSIARSYIARRRHHAALLCWCGGNELTGDAQGGHGGPGMRPVDERHPLIARFARLCQEEDPAHRFLPTSPSGPAFGADESTIGKGLNWDTHGPWKADDLAKWADYLGRDDSLFRSETGAPGASPAEIIRRVKGDLPELPVSHDNPLWRRQPWWIEVDRFRLEHGREPASLEEYVEWSQRRQAEALRLVAAACKGRFPCCGGLLFWMGHDCFPCTANTSLVDYDGRPKPAALAVSAVFKGVPD